MFAASRPICWPTRTAGCCPTAATRSPSCDAWPSGQWRARHPTARLRSGSARSERPGSSRSATRRFSTAIFAATTPTPGYEPRPRIVSRGPEDCSWKSGTEARAPGLRGCGSQHGAATAMGRGSTFVVQPTGPRSWVQRLVVRGRKRELGLGSTALVSLAEARERALSEPQARPRRRRSTRREAPRRRHADLRRRRRPRRRAEAGRLAQPRPRPNLAEQPRTPRLSPHRQPARLRGDERRRAGMSSRRSGTCTRPTPAAIAVEHAVPQCRRVAATPSSFSRSQRKL